MLPEELDSFVGRESELGILTSLVVPGSGSSLVTLTGPGGSGKSRLGLRLAHHVEELQQWPDGVRWVWLRPVRDVARLADHIAISLGIQQATNTAAGIIEALRGRRMLLVFDNCEHLHAPLRQFIAALLRAAPEVTVLATSRSSMDLSGETVHRLAPLSTAAGEDYRHGRSYDAAELFIHRAMQVNSTFTPDGQYRTIVELCHQVDGLPLAIELLARRTATFSLEEIARRRFDLLNAPADDEHEGSGDLLGIGITAPVGGDGLLGIGQDDAQRARTSLENVLRWSWDLCTRRQQVLLQRLAVFPDCFGIDQAEVVCADDALLPRVVIAGTLDALQRQSLVQRQSTADGASQYRLLDTIRAFAEDRLAESGQAEQIRHQHYEWVTQSFATVAREWLGPHETEMLMRCRELLLDVYAALDHCHTTGDMQAAFRLLTAAFAARIPWFGGALPDMSRQWERFVDRYPQRDETRAVALASLAYLEVCRGLPSDVHGARLREARSIADELGVELLAVEIATAVALCFGESDARCVELAAHAYTRLHAEAPGDPMGAMFEMWWAICAAVHADTDTADTVTQRHLENMTESGAEHALGWARWARAAHLLLHRGDEPPALAEAEELFRAGIATASRTGDRWIPIWWSVLAAIRAAKAGEHSRAAELGSIVASLSAITGIRVDQIAGLYPALSAGQNSARSTLGEQDYLERWHAIRDQSAGNFAATVELLTTPVSLTPREREIVTLVVAGYAYSDIASELHIQKESVTRNMSRIYAKTGCRTRAELHTMVARSQPPDTHPDNARPTRTISQDTPDKAAHPGVTRHPKRQGPDR